MLEHRVAFSAIVCSRLQVPVFFFLLEVQSSVTSDNGGWFVAKGLRFGGWAAAAWQLVVENSRSAQMVSSKVPRQRWQHGSGLRAFDEDVQLETTTWPWVSSSFPCWVKNFVSSQNQSSINLSFWVFQWTSKSWMKYGPAGVRTRSTSWRRPSGSPKATNNVVFPSCTRTRVWIWWPARQRWETRGFEACNFSSTWRREEHARMRTFCMFTFCVTFNCPCHRLQIR